MLRTENYLTRSGTKWNQACDLRLARHISYIHHTSNCRQCCRVGNQATDCQLGEFQDADFGENLTDSKSTSGGVLCIFGSHTFVPISWTCENKLLYSIAAQKLKLYRLMQGYAWRDSSIEFVTQSQIVCTRKLEVTPRVYT